MTINITNSISVNTNDYLLSVKTMLEELILYYRVPFNADNTTVTAFNGLELTDFAGLNDFFANYIKIKEIRPNLEHLLGFSVFIPFDFDENCKQDIILTLLIRSEWCTDTKIKQNRLIDYIRFTLLERDFFWSGDIATDINSSNTQNENVSNYRIASFSEYNQKDWFITQLQDNYIISQMSFKFKIFKNN